MKATGERWERCLWQMKRPERVAAVGERRSRAVGKESTGHRNRRQDISLAGAINSTPPRAASLGTFCAATESTAPGRDPNRWDRAGTDQKGNR